MTAQYIIENNLENEWIKEMESEAFGEYRPDLNDAWEECDSFED